MSNIHNYPIESLTFGDDDFYDIDFFNGSGYETRKIKGSTIKAGIIAAGGSNIYNTSGSLDANRIADLAGFDLLFEDWASNRRISIEDALILIEAGDTDGGGIRPIFLKSDNVSLVRKDNVRISLDTNQLTANRNQQFQDNSGIIALLSDIQNIYNTDGTFTGDRSLNGGGFTWENLDVKAFFMQLVPDADFDALGYKIDSTNMNPADAYLLINDTGTGQDILKITKDKQFVIFDEYSLPQVDGTNSQILKTDGAGVTEFVSTQDLESVNFGSTQWSRTLPSPETLGGANEIANGFTFFTNADKVAGGTTAYDEYDIAFGISIILDVANTNGTANINILGVDYPMTFATDNFTTVSNWLTANQATLNALNVRVFRLGSGTDGRLRFCAAEATLNGITFTNLTGDIAATIQNEFTGSATASPDHVLVPYVGTAYEGQRINHNFRVNFGIVGGSNQYYGLSLRRYEDDSVIGSELVVQRNNDVEGTQENFISYTAGASDPFVLGGFYFALRNDTGQDVQIFNNIGILVQNYYQKLTQF